MTSEIYENEKVSNEEEVIENEVSLEQLIENEEDRMKLAPAFTRLGILINAKVLNVLQKEIVMISNKFP